MKVLKEQTTGNFIICHDNGTPLEAPTTATTGVTTTGVTTKTPLVPQMFTFPATGQGVRIIAQGEDGQPWFVAKDVCDCLGLTNGRQAVTVLDADEKATVRISDGTSPHGGNPNKTIISEPGMYALILRSNKPEARAFSKWVRSEVLPSIRRTGGYIITQPDETPEIIMARALFVAKDSIDRLNAQLTAAQPKLETYDALLNTDTLYTMTEAAKHFNMSARRLNNILLHENWIFKKSVDKMGKDIPTVNMPRQRIIDQGYAKVRSRKPMNGNGVFSQMYLTAKGLIALERLLNRRYA